MEISRLTHAASAPASPTLRVSCCHSRARLASGWLAGLYREGVEPSGSLRRVSDQVVIPPSCPPDAMKIFSRISFGTFSRGLSSGKVGTQGSMTLSGTLRSPLRRLPAPSTNSRAVIHERATTAHRCFAAETTLPRRSQTKWQRQAGAEGHLDGLFIRSHLGSRVEPQGDRAETTAIA
jgi:hypothetical protein